MEVQGVLETAIYAQDLEAAARFYSEVLGLEIIAREPGRHVFFQAGRGVFLVFNPQTTSAKSTVIAGEKIPLHGAVGPGHMAFEIPERDIAAWRNKFNLLSVAIESEVVWPNGGRSLYFRDPAGNSIELATPKLWGFSESAAR